MTDPDHMNIAHELRQLAIGAIWGVLLCALTLGTATAAYHGARIAGFWIHEQVIR